MTSDLLDVVRAFHRGAPLVASDGPVVFKEPYAPYIPAGWNRRLIVAEAQNLAGNTDYIRMLEAASEEDRSDACIGAPRGIWASALGMTVL